MKEGMIGKCCESKNFTCAKSSNYIIEYAVLIFVLWSRYVYVPVIKATHPKFEARSTTREWTSRHIHWGVAQFLEENDDEQIIIHVWPDLKKMGESELHKCIQLFIHEAKAHWTFWRKDNWDWDQW